MKNWFKHEEKKLHKVFGSLFYYKNGLNQVNGKFIKHFEITNDNIKITIQNNSNSIISPRFTIYFLNDYGFITSSYHKEYTIFDEDIKPGEIKIIDGNISFEFEKPDLFYC